MKAICLSARLTNTNLNCRKGASGLRGSAAAIRRHISCSHCTIEGAAGFSASRSAQLTRKSCSFQPGFHTMRFAMLVIEIRAGLGRNSCQSSEVSRADLSRINSIRGEGAILSKKRHEGIRAGKSSLKLCSKVSGFSRCGSHLLFFLASEDRSRESVSRAISRVNAVIKTL